MSSQKTTHQGSLRGSYEIPMEQSITSGGGGGKTTPSQAGIDATGPGESSHDQSTKRNASSPRRVRIEDGSDGEGRSDHVPEAESSQESRDTRRKTPKDSPAYVAPIGSIPKPTPVESITSNLHPTPPPEGESSDPPRKRPIYQIPKDHLVGKTIDDFGDILDDDGAVLGRVEGDLPSMVGRTISNARGDVLGDDGELLGYVAEVGPGDSVEHESQQQHPTRDLAEVMESMAAAGKGPGGLRVDPFGNILDAEGNVVGSFHDNKSGFGRKSRDGGNETSSTNAAPEKTPTSAQGPGATGSQPSSGPQPKQNAQSFRKQPEERQPSPSDIFMDIKSTTEGIQLTIRIPTVFNTGGQPLQPKIVFS